MIQLIACDLDETLLNDQHELSNKNIAAIRKARALGVKFVPATGRGFRTIKNTLQKLDLFQAPDEYVISFNGGVITENQDFQILHLDALSNKTAECLFQRGKNLDVCIHIFTEDTIYTHHYVPEEQQYLDGLCDVVEFDEPDLSFLKGKKIIKVIYMNLDTMYLKKLEEQMNDLTEAIDISYSSNRYMEFNHKHVNKGQGLRHLSKLLKIPKEATLAIGDNWNDLSMLQAAGIGVGVQNCVAEMKPHCDYITKATNNEDAIAEVIERFILHPLKNKEKGRCFYENKCRKRSNSKYSGQCPSSNRPC